MGADLLALKRALPLRPGTAPSKLSALELLHLIYALLPWLAIRMPYIVIFKHFIPFITGYRVKSRITEEVGRQWFADVVAKATAFLLSRMTPNQGRCTFFGRHLPYKVGFAHPSFWHYKHLVKRVEEPNFVGTWIADQKTERKDDDMVLLNVHGGGFVIDTGGLTQPFWLALWKEMNEKKRRRFSIFHIDYELAPEFVFPSQIIETLAAYSHLVFNLGIKPERICLVGDSAGGTIIAGALLHLARPSPDILMPTTFRVDELKKPGTVIFISPFVKLVSQGHSRLGSFDEFDLIEGRVATHFTLGYVGDSPYNSPMPSWSPMHIFHPLKYDYILDEPYAHEAHHGKHPPVDIEDRAGRLNTIYKSPYVNPSMVNDSAWWREALPDKTLVTWGGKEVFGDDIRIFAVGLQKAGVPIQRLVKPLGVHDWILYDWVIPFLARTNSKGPDSNKEWGVERLGVFLESSVAEAKHGKLPADESVKAKM